MGRAPLAIDHQSLVRDRLFGNSLTVVAKKYGVSRAERGEIHARSHETRGRPGRRFQPVAAQAPAECVA